MLLRSETPSPYHRRIGAHPSASQSSSDVSAACSAQKEYQCYDPPLRQTDKEKYVLRLALDLTKRTIFYSIELKRTLNFSLPLFMYMH